MNSELPLAGRFRRLVATLVDAILVPALSFVLVMITDVMEDAEDYANADLMILWIFLLAVVAYLILNGYTLWHRGQTLGKWIMDIAIVSASSHIQEGVMCGGDESKSTYVPAPLWKLICIRALFFPVLFLTLVPWLTLLPVLDQALIFGKRRRCLHDLVAGTIVVRV
ncbi:MAG: RDD family protein [bacterium]